MLVIQGSSKILLFTSLHKKKSSTNYEGFVNKSSFCFFCNVFSLDKLVIIVISLKIFIFFLNNYSHDDFAIN